MAKSTPRRRERKIPVAESAPDVVAGAAGEVERLPLNATPNRKRRRPDQPAPVSPSSPISPQKRSPLSRRALCEADVNGATRTANAVVTCCSPKSPRKRLFAGSPQRSRWNPRDPAQMNAVKEAFHLSSAPETVACRDDEQMQILEFCKTCIKQETGGSLYVCGCPGTGKTLTVKKVEELLIGWAKKVGLESPVTVSINCSSLASASEIFPKILERWRVPGVSGAASALQQLRDSFSQRKPPSGGRSLMVVVDEMDYLITKDRAVLHDLFMLASRPFSRFILIGIANAIDLADRFLPKLESLQCKPAVVTFRAYNKDQILEILHRRLAALGCDVFEPPALEFCARRVAAASGDMRRALSVCASAIDEFEREFKTGGAAGRKAELVSFEDVDGALSKAFRTPVVDTIRSLPQHQQMILCALVKLLTNRKSSTIGDLNKAYVEVCKSVQVAAAGATELSSMCRVLSDQGLVNLGSCREEKLRKVSLAVDGADVAFSLQGIRFFRQCLQ